MSAPRGDPRLRMRTLKVAVQGLCHSIKLRTNCTQGSYRGIEADLTNALPALTFDRLPNVTVKAFNDRVRTAINNSGFEFLSRCVTVNLASADWPKAGGRFNLTIALKSLAALRVVGATVLAQFVVLGELSL